MPRVRASLAEWRSYPSHSVWIHCFHCNALIPKTLYGPIPRSECGRNNHMSVLERSKMPHIKYRPIANRLWPVWLEGGSLQSVSIKILRSVAPASLCRGGSRLRNTECMLDRFYGFVSTPGTLTPPKQIQANRELEPIPCCRA